MKHTRTVLQLFAMYNRDTMKWKIPLWRNNEFSHNADTADQVCTFRDGVPQNAPRENELGTKSIMVTSLTPALRLRNEELRLRETTSLRDVSTVPSLHPSYFSLALREPRAPFYRTNNFLTRQLNQKRLLLRFELIQRRMRARIRGDVGVRFGNGLN